MILRCIWKIKRSPSFQWMIIYLFLTIHRCCRWSNPILLPGFYQNLKHGWFSWLQNRVLLSLFPLGRVSLHGRNWGNFSLPDSWRLKGRRKKKQEGRSAILFCPLRSFLRQRRGQRRLRQLIFITCSHKTKTLPPRNKDKLLDMQLFQNLAVL